MRQQTTVLHQVDVGDFEELLHRLSFSGYRVMPGNLTILQRQEVLHHFNAGKAVNQVCKLMGVHRSTVYWILEQQRVRGTLETKKGKECFK